MTNFIPRFSKWVMDVSIKNYVREFFVATVPRISDIVTFFMFIELFIWNFRGVFFHFSFSFHPTLVEFFSDFSWYVSNAIAIVLASLQTASILFKNSKARSSPISTQVVLETNLFTTYMASMATTVFWSICASGYKRLHSHSVDFID